VAAKLELTAEQTALIRTHLALVFKHDPTMAHEKVKPNSFLDEFERLRRSTGTLEGKPVDGIMYC
jgi:hypothetical protein